MLRFDRSTKLKVERKMMTTANLTDVLVAMVLLSPKQVAEMIPGMTVNNLAQLRFKGTGPR